MSHRICNKNLERDARLVLIDELTEAGYASEVGLFETRINQLKDDVATRTNQVISVCPLCKRVYHTGDTLCSCRPAVTKKSPKGNGKHVQVECQMRVVGLGNRHELRSRMHDISKWERKGNALMLRAARTVQVKQQKFSEESRVISGL